MSACPSSRPSSCTSSCPSSCPHPAPGSNTHPPHADHADHTGHAPLACCGSGHTGHSGHHGHHHRHPAPRHDGNPAAPASPGAPGRLLLRIPAMDCPTEEGQIRRALEAVPGLGALRFDLAARTLAVEAPAATWPAVTAALDGLGFRSQRLSTPPPPEQGVQARRRELGRLGAALLLAACAELLHALAPPGWLGQAAGLAVAAGAIGLSGLGVFLKGWQALRRGQLNINALMAVAVSGAVLIGQWPEAAMVMALYALAELIEARAVERARQAITGLLALSPAQAETRQPDGRWVAVPARDVPVGATVRVKPGERFALDGLVTAGHSTVDEAPITGESVPVDKAPGDHVFAGTINQGGALEFEVTQAAGQTVLAGILHAVEAAQAQRAPTQRWVDRFAAVYTPAIFALALGVAVAGPLVMGWGVLQAVYKALVLLVIACPCALVISTPLTLVSGLAAAARRGILIKGGVHLEQARRVRIVALDKTGTLTEGRPQLVARHAQVGHPDRADTDMPGDTVWAIAHSLAARSDHPVAQAIARGLGGPSEARPVSDFQAEPGQGIRGVIDGQVYTLGQPRSAAAQGLVTAPWQPVIDAEQAQGRSVSLLADPARVLAVLAVADAPKPSSREAVAALRAEGVEPVMLTGDHAASARAVAQAVGIDRVEAQLLPQDKMRWVTDAGQRQAVAMVGDGINDAPSLAAAHLSVSMGAAGSDIAKEAADVLIMNDDLRKLPELLRLSRRTHAVLWQNIVLALGIKAGFFALALTGSATMWMAVFADMGASLLVVFNGLRLLRGVSRG